MFFGARPGEGISEPVVLGTDPGGLCPVVMDDLVRGIDACHPKPVIVGRSAVLDEPKTSRRIRENCDVLIDQLRAPNSDHKQVSEQFEIGYM